MNGIRRVVASVMAAGALAGALTSCLSETYDSDFNASSEPVVSGTESMVSTGASGLLMFDEGIPLTLTHTSWYMKDDLEELTKTSSLAFVGTVSEYIERVKVLPLTEVPPEDSGYTVYDGVVFSVEELLIGTFPTSEDTVTVAIEALELDAVGNPRFRIQQSPFETVEPGILARYRPEKPRYLVYVTEDRDQESPFYDSGYYFFNTPGGVAPMLNNDRIGVAADRPLSLPMISEGGASMRPSLDDARAVARVLDSADGSAEWTPISPFDVIEPSPDSPGPIGAVGD